MNWSKENLPITDNCMAFTALVNDVTYIKSSESSAFIKSATK